MRILEMFPIVLPSLQKAKIYFLWITIDFLVYTRYLLTYLALVIILYIPDGKTRQNIRRNFVGIA
jgi:hypothetical protein